MVFEKEGQFEEALIARLSGKGWESRVLKYPTEADLLRNWADILFENNRGINRLNDTPLSDGEMQQIMEQINTLRTPLKLNGFINGKIVTIKRDNQADKLHFGKEVSLKIYDRQEIAAGQSRYQIAQQPVFNRRSPMFNNRRGDLLLLVNGMPVIHIELKRSGIPVSQACNQIEKYAHEGVSSGLLSLVQIFVAMEPNETRYFANPGPDGRFNPNYFFHWADANNEPINDWERIAATLLSIPMAHQLIGFYTVADKSDGVLKIMRSYQYYAANAISDRVSKHNWSIAEQHGGYVWHTTGSGKTMTSFKSAQLIANSGDADKVVFLMDRIELGTQSLAEYRSFADDSDDVQATENTDVLVAKMKSANPAHTLIVTSIQKMSHIKLGEGALKARDIEIMTGKRIVFIVDEAHRSTFGDMLRDIKNTFREALFFGFTGTPIFDENQKKKNMTTDVFGDELHRYSIADGIRDKNVLGFDPYMVLTYQDKDLRRTVGLEKAKAQTETEAIADPKKSSIYYRYMNDVPMAGHTGDDGKYVKGIEDELPKGQYETEKHRQAVVDDILKNWVQYSHGGKFHAIFATSSITEAITYYRMFKAQQPDLKVSALFDPNIDNDGDEVEVSREAKQKRALFKEDGLVELMSDYNARYERNFDLANHARFKKDLANRLAHKEPYTRIVATPEQQLDLMIVVDQMLTGFDSKWVNTLYMDKILRYENIIQAFSRTNRLFGPEKPFGTIRYYRMPHTMARNIEDAVKLYSGDRPIGLFAQRLGENLEKMNDIFADITALFTSAGEPDLAHLPADNSEKGKFASLFKEFNEYLEAAKVQGFLWSKEHYEKDILGDAAQEDMDLGFSQDDYVKLVQRYKELATPKDPPDLQGGEDVPYDIDTHLAEIDTGLIDANYMNSRFEKFLRTLGGKDAEESLGELQKTFATLTQEEQKYANIFIHDIQAGNVALVAGKAFRDYISEYQIHARNDEISKLVKAFGIDEGKLRQIMAAGVSESTLNEYGRFDDLKATADKAKAKVFFDSRDGKDYKAFAVNVRLQDFLKKFILSGGTIA